MQHFLVVVVTVVAIDVAVAHGFANEQAGDLGEGEPLRLREVQEDEDDRQRCHETVYPEDAGKADNVVQIGKQFEGDKDTNVPEN